MTTIYKVEKQNGQVGIVTLRHTAIGPAVLRFEKELMDQSEVRSVERIHRTEMDYYVVQVTCTPADSTARIAQSL